MTTNSELLDRIGHEPNMSAAGQRHQTSTSSTERSKVARPDVDRRTRNEECKLIQQVFLLPDSPRRQAVLFAEVERHAESAGICARTAELLAAFQVDGSVCVVDADLREPSLHHRFRPRGTNGHGLLDVLQDGARARSAVSQVSSNLWFLPAGSSVAEHETTSTPDRLRSLFQELREEFEYVIIKAPPFNDSADSMLLSQLSDGVILIVEAHTTRRERALRVKESLTAAHVPVLGVILNNRTYPIPEQLYRKL